MGFPHRAAHARVKVESSVCAISNMQRRYTLFAYLLWLLLGWLGVHHFYLRRHKQGVLWLTSFSGFFGIGKAAVRAILVYYVPLCAVFGRVGV